MPRVYDRTPRAQDDKNPLKNLLNYDALDVDIRNLASVLQQSIQGVLDGVLAFIKEVTGVDLTTVFQGLDITNPGAVLASIVQIVTDVINRILAPFGINDVSGTITEALNTLVTTIMTPFTILTHLGDFMEDLFGQHGSQIAGLAAQVNALRLSLDPAITDATGAYDSCKTAAKFTEVIGTIQPTGWGAFDAYHITAAHHNLKPKTNRHGAGIRVKLKKTGITRVHICSDDAMTNFVCLELDNPVSGSDVVRVRTGTSPTDLVTQTSFETRIAAESFWEIFYEPYDETSLTSNTFHVFCGGEPVLPLRWRDDGNIVIHPEDPVANPQRVGFTLNGLNHSTRRGFAITDFTWYDWQDASPQ